MSEGGINRTLRASKTTRTSAVAGLTAIALVGLLVGCSSSKSGSGDRTESGAATPTSTATSPVTMANGLPSTQTVNVASQVPVGTAGSSATAANAFGVWQTMKQTRYQHTYSEDVATGSYFVDCVGWTSYLLSNSAPTANASLRAGTGVTNKHFVPTPLKYETFFNSLANKPQPGWSTISSVANLQPGDIMAWQPESNNTGPTVGHAIVVIGSAVQQQDGSYAVPVMDSTGTPHGPNDTRRTDPRNLTDSKGQPSGIGIGTIGFSVNGSGFPTAVIWSLGTKPVPKTIGMARPTS